MKHCIICLLMAFTQAIPVAAASFDTHGFGTKLNGWRKDGTAVFAFSNTSYKAHRPAVTHSPSGLMFLSARVDLLAHADKGAVCQLVMSFSRAGELETIQVKGRVHGRSMNTATVRRREFIAKPHGVEEGPDAVTMSVKKANPTDEMLAEVFRRFDQELNKLVKAQPPLRRDLFSRLSKQRVETADLSGGLRQHVHLILQCVRSR